MIVDERLTDLEAGLADLDKTIMALAVLVDALGVPVISGTRARAIRSPDRSIEVAESDDGNAVELRLPDGFEEGFSDRFAVLEKRLVHVNSVLEALAGVEHGETILLPGVHKVVESDEDRSDYRAGWLVVVGATLLAAAGLVWWLT